VLKQQLNGQLHGKQGTTKFQIQNRKTFNTFNTQDSCTWNISRNSDSAAD